jgi:hypothetical protein
MDDDQEDLKLPGVGSLPISYIESEQRLLDKLGRHAVVLLMTASESERAIITIDRDGMMEVGSAILQLLSILRNKKLVS